MPSHSFASGIEFVHQLAHGAHPVKPTHVFAAEEESFLHVALHRLDEGVGDAVGHGGGVAHDQREFLLPFPG